LRSSICERSPITCSTPNIPTTRGKAGFLEALGFSVDAVDTLIDALRGIAVTGEVVNLVETVHGEEYVVTGVLSLHTGQGPARMVQTVWMIGHGQDAPRLVSAYPRRK
jgi:hypothetical protein